MDTENNKILKISSSYSEYVVRSACSWAFPAPEEFPSIKVDMDSWVLTFDRALSCDSINKLNSYINDYRLREIIDSETGRERQKIVSRALSSVYREKDDD
ncbi:hypothetical protein [Oceanicoccus sagamiensis]|uniref:His-Xaa-Ser system protein HxsD n=1 Tax=Oceanicoccus sagamiensis TaxID=716816 RepID=A0A1X9N5B9_9GAMM|nr:hypothetical protein [Oceanicoccus sagamiensis]ARN73308.1 hypothetical protein BST96_03820 [Oceanicoccus sagamiensis]